MTTVIIKVKDQGVREALNRLDSRAVGLAPAPSAAWTGWLSARR